MTIQFEELLSIICTRVNPGNSNDFQSIYSVSTATEAKLAFDVLVAHGFDAKVYHQPEKMSKIYVTTPTSPADQVEKNLAAAMAYARTLKQVKNTIQQHCAASQPAMEYSMSFVNSQPAGKQISIQITPASGASETDRLTAATPAPSAARPVASTPIAASSVQTHVPKGKYAAKAKSHYEELSSGPAVGKSKYPGALAADGTSQQNSLRRRMMLYLFGNIATSSFAFLVMVVIIGILFSFFIFAKGFLCPDFAVANKNKAWYCQTDSAK